MKIRIFLKEISRSIVVEGCLSCPHGDFGYGYGSCKISGLNIFPYVNSPLHSECPLQSLPQTTSYLNPISDNEVGKYFEVLHAEGKIKYASVGGVE